MYRQVLVAVLCFCFHAFVYASADVDSRIVGGNNATFYVCSHAVAIRVVNRDFLCNGVLISSRDVLTAASCIYNGLYVRNESDLLVVAGTIGNSASAPGAIPMSVRKLWYTANDPSRIGDVAVLRLNVSLLTGGVPWVSVPNFGTQAPLVNSSCSICGWGSNTISGPPALLLQTLNINVQSSVSPNCTRAAGGTIPARTICAGNPLQVGSGACTNDLGAPLMCNGVLYGVLTNTGGCGALHEVSIFADAVANLAWIRNRTQTEVVVVPPNKPGGNGTGGSAQVSLKLGMMVIAVLTAFVLR